MSQFGKSWFATASKMSCAFAIAFFLGACGGGSGSEAVGADQTDPTIVAEGSQVPATETAVRGRPGRGNGVNNGRPGGSNSSPGTDGSTPGSGSDGSGGAPSTPSEPSTPTNPSNPTNPSTPPDDGAEEPSPGDDSSAPSDPGPGTAAVDPKFFALTKGWANTEGGRGGQIVKVTSLARSGPGTLKAALEQSGPRIIVFEVSGNIDLNGEQLQIRNPYVTIAGQTAPSPGITIVRGGIATYTHDVIIQHIRVRPGTEAGSGMDALETQTGSYNVIVDHCSFSWGTDETLSAAGWPFNGSSLEQWRERASNRITFSNNIVAEALSTGYGSLIQDNVTKILLYGNLWAHNKERTPNFGGATQGAVINNLIYNPGGKFLDYTFLNSKWDAEGKGMRVNGKLTAIGNVGRAGPSTTADAFFKTVSNGDVEYYGHDNIATRRNGTAYPQTAQSTYLTNPQGQILVQSSPPVMPPGVTPMSSSMVEQHVLKYVGARPWDRDAHDERVLADVRNGTGKMITSQSQVGGYPMSVERTRPFNPDHWDLETMVPRVPEAL